MTAALIMYGTIIGLVVAAAARGAESVARSIGHPLRWIWVGALAITIGLVMLAPYRETMLATPVTAVAMTVPTAQPFVESSASWMSVARATIEQAGQAVIEPLQTAIGVVRDVLPAWAGRYLLVLWAAFSASLILLFAAVYLWLWRARRAWPLTDVHGVRVRVAPSAGPAVIGLSRPEIIVPRWLFVRGHDEQRLVIAHEVEHVRARDPWLLAFGCVAVALVPWNVAAWWMLERLRLAVEIDCDARVLRGNVAPRSYGELLIDLAEHCSGFRVGAPALADDASHLQQRLLAMKRPIARFAIARGGVAAVFTLAALVVACEAKLPTSTEIAAMDVATAERAATRTMFKQADTGAVRYVIDGSMATATEARALRPDQIKAIAVVRDDKAATNEVRIRRVDTLMTNNLVRTAAVLVRDVVPADASLTTKPGGLREFDGIALINGVRATNAEIRALDRESIVSVEVIKGPSAARLYNDPAAANGVITITTRIKR